MEVLGLFQFDWWIWPSNSSLSFFLQQRHQFSCTVTCTISISCQGSIDGWQLIRRGLRVNLRTKSELSWKIRLRDSTRMLRSNAGDSKYCQTNSTSIESGC